MTLAFAVCIAGLLLAACLLLVHYARHLAERKRRYALLDSAVVKVRHELPGEIRPSPDVAELREVENDLADEHIAVVLLDKTGPGTGSVPRSAVGISAKHWDIANTHGVEFLALMANAYRARVGGKYHHDRFVVGQNRAHTLNDQAILLAAFSVMMGGAATLGAWLLVGRTLSPYRQPVAAGADGDGGGSGQARLTAPSQDAEVVELVSTLNDLLTRQREANAARGRFYAAASHELRTPLQALSGHLELALQRPRTGEGVPCRRAGSPRADSPPDHADPRPVAPASGGGRSASGAGAG